MLKLQRIIIHNFRQYRDVDLKFEDDKGTFLFIGKTGMGKSNFLNAICWCLYGKQPFKSQDSNRFFLNEESALKNKFDEVSVRLEINCDGKIYLFQRTQRETQESKLTVMINSNGSMDVIKSNPTYIVNSFLPENIREFFLFDGESVQKLFKGNYAPNLKESIWRVSNVELLDKAIEHLGHVKTELRRVMSREIPEAKDLEQKLSDLEAKIKVNKVEIDKIIKNRQDLEVKKRDLQNKVKKSEKYRGLQEKRDDLESSLKQIENVQLKNIQMLINTSIVDVLPFIFISDNIISVAQKIESSTEKGEIPPKIKTKFIEELIENHECICGTPLHPDSPELQRLLSLKESVEPSDKKAFILEDKYHINSLMKELNQFPNHLDVLRNQRAELITQRNEQQKALKEISSQLVAAPDTDISGIEKMIQIIEDTLREDAIKEGQYKNDNVTLESQRQDVDNKLKESISSKLKYELEKKKYEFAEQALDNMMYIRDHIVRQVRGAVSNETNINFQNLIWKKDDFDKVDFTEDYEVMISKRGQNRIGSLNDSGLSTGELKVLGFAVIKALSKVSGFAGVPVFIDGPLEYLDNEVQENFLASLVNYMPDKQLFIFSPDRDSIIHFGEKSVKKSNFYRLKRPDGSKSTIISLYS